MPFLAAEASLQHLPCPEGRKAMLKEEKKATTIVSYLLVCLGNEIRAVKTKKSLLSSD